MSTQCSILTKYTPSYGDEESGGWRMGPWKLGAGSGWWMELGWVSTVMAMEKRSQAEGRLPCRGKIGVWRM
jgi:hypothetical protein